MEVDLCGIAGRVSRLGLYTKPPGDAGCLGPNMVEVAGPGPTARWWVVLGPTATGDEGVTEGR